MIGEAIEAWRSKNGKSIRDLAGEIGVSRSTLHRVEGGQPIDGRTQMKLINWLFPDKKD